MSIASPGPIHAPDSQIDHMTDQLTDWVQYLPKKNTQWDKKYRKVKIFPFKTEKNQEVMR